MRSVDLIARVWAAVVAGGAVACAGDDPQYDPLGPRTIVAAELRDGWLLAAAWGMGPSEGAATLHLEDDGGDVLDLAVDVHIFDVGANVSWLQRPLDAPLTLPGPITARALLTDYWGAEAAISVAAGPSAGVWQSNAGVSIAWVNFVYGLGLNVASGSLLTLAAQNDPADSAVCEDSEDCEDNERCTFAGQCEPE